MTMAETISPYVQLARADNPGIMTLDGTNTWILRAPGAQGCVVVDPGPPGEHLDAVLAAAGEVELVLFTHHHYDHTECLDEIVQRTGAAARAIDAAFCRSGDELSDGELISAGGVTLEVVATPGHTADSMCLLLVEEAALLTGDTVLGRGTTVVAWPDGVLGPYLDSLARIRELITEGLVLRLLPGHGPVVEDPPPVVDYYLEHRAERLEQVRSAVSQGAQTPRDVVEIVYADVDESLWGAAELSVRAQLDFLNSRS
jgi:glyoxylase-like metal-dependent hydrolase (beta-lactamase superfamily II)